MLGEVTK